MRALTPLFILLSLFTACLQAAPGDLDPGYNPSVYASSTIRGINGISINEDGNAAVGGTVFGYQKADGYEILKEVSPEGNPSLSFDAVSLNIAGNFIIRQWDEKILVAGSNLFVSLNDYRGVQRLNRDGSLDESFSAHVSNGTVNAMVIQPDGKIIIGGSFLTVNGVAKTKLARLNTDGSLDEGFTPSVTGNVNTMAIVANQKIILGGDFTAINDSSRNSIARLNADGSLDEVFQTSIQRNSGTLPGYVYSVVVHANGELTVGGEFSRVNGSTIFNLVRLHEDGTVLKALSTSSTVRTAVLQADGKLLVGGAIRAVQTPDFAWFPTLVRLMADGSTDATFVPPELQTWANNNFRLNALALQNDGKLLFGLALNTFRLLPAAPLLLHRLENDAATESLTMTGGNRIEWLRGGAAPEVSEVRFEISENGSDWQFLGMGTRIANGWELREQSLSTSGFLRARGRTCGGSQNGSCGLVGKTISLGGGTAQIVLESPEEEVHTGDSGAYDFGSNYAVRTFKIRNSGTAVLRIESISFEDVVGCLISANSEEMDRTLEPGAETSFAVFMDPLLEYYNYLHPAATMKIASNAGDNPGLQFSLSGEFAFSPTASIDSLSLYYNQKNGDYVNLSFTGYFFPKNTDYTLWIPSYLRSADLMIQFNDENYFQGRKVKVNGINSNFRNSIRTDFALVPEPIVIESLSPDGQNWETYTIRVYRSPPKPGELDLSFAPQTWFGTSSITIDAILPDGKMLVMGNRVNEDGSLDLSFYSAFSSWHSPFHVQSDSSILSIGTNRVQKFEPNGQTQWISYTHRPASFIRLQDGSILTGSDSFESSKRSLTRLSTDGVLDETYVSPVSGNVLAMLEFPDGRALISGAIVSRLGSPALAVGRLLADGSLDASYPVVSADGNVQAMIRQPDGKILLYGDFSKILGQPRRLCARLNADGSLDPTFAPGLSNLWRIDGAVLQADGKILLVGSFSPFNPPSSMLTLIRLNPDGSFDRSLEAYSSSYVTNILLQKNGSIVVSGRFDKFNGVPVGVLARLHNNPATESLTIPDATRVLWERGGTAPEALSVSFECSTDDGATWTLLGQGSYIPGGWELTGLNLPPSGQVRARAVVQSGHKSRSRGLVETVAAFAFTPAALVVENDAGHPWISGATADFGQAGLGGLKRQNLMIKNPGETRLSDIRVEIEGAHASDFRLQEAVTASLPKEGQQTLKFLFIPSKLGIRTAVAKIYSPDQGSGPVQIVLTGVGIRAEAPVVKTLPATDVHPASVRFNGTVTARGIAREVFFEYGTTPNFGSLLALSPTTVEGNSVETVRRTLDGLLPKTRYYFRIRAASAEGGATGATLTFTTGNRAPVARDDQWIYVRTPGPISLNVLANDADPDGDALSLASFTPLSPEGGGSLVKFGNNVVLTPAEHIPQSTFTYRIKDAAGALSEPATVRILMTEATLSGSSSGLVAAAGMTYVLDISTYATWKIVNPMPWVRVDVMEGFGDRRLQITVLPNTTVKPRAGTLTIGYATHEITQDGVLLPVLEQPGLPLPPAYVGAAFELPIMTQNLPVIYTVKNLPPGLTISGDTGVISGVPTRAGRYAISLRARNVAGAAVDTVLLDLEVAELPREFQGRHEGVISLSGTRPRSLGGRYELTVTATGAFTGKVIQGTKTEAMKGSLAVDPTVPTRAVGTATLPGSKTAPLRQFKVELHSNGDGSHNAELLTDGVRTDAGYGWWIPWNGKDRLPTAYVETYSFVTSPVTSTGPAPEGHGYGTFTVAEKTGAVKITGRLADGTPYLASAYVGARGDIALYQSLYSQGGALVGALVLGTNEEREDNNVFGSMDWVKYPVDAKSKDLAYRNGFSLTGLLPRGGVLPKLAPSGRILNLPESESPQAELKFSGGGVTAPFEAVVTVTNPSPKGLTNKAAVSTTPQAVALPQLDAKKGTFSGSFTLTGSTPALTRKTAFSGQAVQIDGVVKGYGFFLLPELPPEGGSLKTSPLQAGAVLFQAAPPP